MEVRKTLTPGNPGTKHLLDLYGNQLLCVRYRYDEASGKRYKTVELIVDEKTYKHRQIDHNLLTQS